MSTAAGQAPRGRPSTGARERILAAALETLKADGYAGLTIAKVAARAGENKALVSYHFASKQGLIAAAARELGRVLTENVLDGLREARTAEEIIRGSVDGTWRLLESDERLARVYFDLNAVSIVEPDVRAVVRDVKAQWRENLADLLRGAGLPQRLAETVTLLVIAGNEGLALEWIERGETAGLRRARELFVNATLAGLRGEAT